MPRTLALVALTIALLLAATGSASAHHFDSLLARTSVCPGQTDTRRSVDDQEWTMRCMHNHVRSKRGLPYLSTRSRLMTAAGSKSADIVRCQDFAHEACGRDTFYWTQRSGYTSGCWGGGENIAWGSGSLGSVRAIMSAWLHSDPHRRNLFKSGYRDKGVGLVKGTFRGYPGSQVWTTQFGYRC
jgi:uncharacterized protein YkwD